MVGVVDGHEQGFGREEGEEEFRSNSVGLEESVDVRGVEGESDVAGAVAEVVDLRDGRKKERGGKRDEREGGKRGEG